MSRKTDREGVLKSSLEIVSIDKAVERAVADAPIRNLRIFERDVYEASGFIVADDYFALIDNPPYDKSYVDGFAVIAEDTFGASPLNPVRLRLVGSMKPSDSPLKHVLKRGQAVEVSTGTPLPVNSDAVVMYEDATVANGYVEVAKPISPWTNVARRGEDYRRGDVLVKKGSLLKPWDLALLSSSGYKYVKVYEKIRVGIICTGSEIIEPGSTLREGSSYESTCVLIKNYMDQLTFVTTSYYGVIPDDEEILIEKLNKIIKENHLAIVSGGAGFSKVDMTKKVLDTRGRWIFKGIAARPGKPTGLALIEEKPVFSLSGFPVAAWVALEALVTPYLYGSLGIEPPAKPRVKAIMKRRVPNTVGYRGFIRVRLFTENNRLYCEPYLIKGSGVLSSLSKSNGYVIIPEHKEGVNEGEEVEVILI